MLMRAALFSSTAQKTLQDAGDKASSAVQALISWRQAVVILLYR